MSARPWGVSATQGGMLVVTNPRVIALKRSSSVGRVPVGVERHLKTARVKSRGLGSIHCAFSPRASPSSPWQPAQYRVYSGRPAPAWPVSFPICASCAPAVAPAANSATLQPEATAIQRVYDLIGGLLSEGEVEGDEQAAAPHLRRGGRGIDAGAVPAEGHESRRPGHCEFTVQGHPVAAGHEGIVAEAEREGVGVAERLGDGGITLLRHPRQLVAPL